MSYVKKPDAQWELDVKKLDICWELRAQTIMSVADQFHGNTQKEH